MHKAETNKLYKILAVAASAIALALGAAGVASASADTTEPPTDSAPAHTEHAETPGTLAVDGSAEATSPEAEEFCAAEIAVEAAVNSGDEAAIGSAIESLTAAVPDEEVGAAVEAVLATFEEGGPEFEAAYAEVIDWMKANCGYAEIDVTASEFEFAGVPAEVPAGPAIISLENAGEQVHEFAVLQVNEDVTLSAEEIAALPEEEVMALGPTVAFAFTFPGSVGYGTADLAPGRYVGVCYLFDGATPDVLMQLEELGVDGPEDTIPADAGIEIGDSHYTLGMVHEFTVV
jgi:hypothetical protein